MRIAIIPARGGSKRIPRKNIKLFGDRPMISWSIQAALKSRLFDHVIVSTDDDEIAKVACRYGAEVPFMRPEELSDDHTGTIPVIAHAIDWVNQNIGPVEVACCIYATAPFIDPEDLKRGFDVLQQSEADYAFSVTRYAFPIQRAIYITTDQRLQMFCPEKFNVRSQDLEEAFHDAGQFYWGRGEAWLAGRPIFSLAAAPVILPRRRVQDIDTPEDWDLAEWMFRAMNDQAVFFNKIGKVR